MSVEITLLVLLAAVLHAGWNGLLRAGPDRFWSMTVMCIAIAAICGCFAPFVQAPGRASWGYLVLSAFLHVAYNLFLVRTYRHGDLGQTYPIARGTSPMLVALGAALFAGEILEPASLAGVILISAGILALAFQGRHLGFESVIYAIGTGVFIGAYRVVDGIGARLAETSLGYTVWMSLLWVLLMPTVYVAAQGWRDLLRGKRETLSAAGGGAMSLAGYGMIIFAMSLGPMGAVSALRETSVVFAALIGRFFLHERLSAFRLAACVVVATGAVFIGYEGHTQGALTAPPAHAGSGR